MSAFSLVCLGDVMLARGVSEVLRRKDPAYVWGDTLPAVMAGDLRLANLECCISARGRPFDPPRVFNFGAEPKAVECLTVAGVEVVTLANNHTLDYGEEALMDTLAILDGAGVAHVGAGANIASARENLVIDAPDGRRVGFVGFTDNFPEYAAEGERPGTFHLQIGDGSLPIVAERVKALRQEGADVVVVTAHWGPNMRRRPPRRFVDFARSVIDAGADLWFGHSAHIFQGVEYHNGKPVIYDAGDFIDDYALDENLRNDLSLLWTVHFGEQIRVEATPVKLEFAYTELARGEEFEWITKTLSELCNELGTTVRKGDEKLLIEPA